MRPDATGPVHRGCPNYDSTVRVWDAATGAPVGDPFTGHTGSVWSVGTVNLLGLPEHMSMVGSVGRISGVVG
jgi:WD40 repeat protein